MIFITEMQPIAGNQLIDWTKDDIGWHMEMTNADNRINMRHLGYKMRMFGKVFAAPCGWLLGECNAWEIALDDNRFSLTIEIRRNGKLFYGYSGEFEVVGVMRRD